MHVAQTLGSAAARAEAGLQRPALRNALHTPDERFSAWLTRNDLSRSAIRSGVTSCIILRMKHAVRGLPVALAFAAIVSAQPASLSYPVAKKVEQVDVYHGVKVADPYRWMEDDNAPATAAWVEAENKVTFPYLEAIPYRRQFQDRVKALNNYVKYSSPSRKGPYYFFFKNDGLQDQSVLYIQKGLDGTPEVLLDP